MSERKVPEQVNVVAGKPYQFSFVVRFSKSNGAEDNEVVVDVEIWRGLILEQSLVIGVHVEEFAVDCNFRAGNHVALEDFVQILENVIRRDVSDVRGNGIGRVVVFECENPKRRVGKNMHRCGFGQERRQSAMRILCPLGQMNLVAGI